MHEYEHVIYESQFRSWLQKIDWRIPHLIPDFFFFLHIFISEMIVSKKPAVIPNYCQDIEKRKIPGYPLW